MLRHLIVLLALGTAIAGHAHASDQALVMITATVMPVCKFFTARPQEGLASGIRREAAIGYTCTSGTVPNFTLPPDTRVSCFACVGEPVLATMPPPVTVSLRGFDASGGPRRTFIVTEYLAHSLPPDGESDPGRNMTLTVAP